MIEGSYDIETLATISKFSSDIWGDIRVAIKLLEKTAVITEMLGKDKITEDIIKEAIKELFGNISNKIANRPGGYTRVLQAENRMGDNAEMAMIELVDFNDIYTKPSKAAEAPAKKTRRGKTKAAASADESAEPEVKKPRAKKSAPKAETATEETTEE